MAAQAFFRDNTDATKKVSIDPAGITTGNTRVLTPADGNMDFRAMRGSQVVTPGPTPTLDLALGGYATLAADQNMAIALSGGQIGLSGRLVITQDVTGSRAITFSNGTITAGAVSLPANTVTYANIYFSGSVYQIELIRSDRTEGMDDLGSIGGAQTINFDAGTADFKKLTLTSNTVFTFSATRKTEFKLLVVQPATLGPHEVTWPASVNGNPPQPNTVASSKSLYRFVFDGSEYHF